MCDLHVGNPDSRRPQPVNRRRVLAGGLAAGLVPLLPRFGGAASAAPSSMRAFGFKPARPASEKHVRPIMFPVLPDPKLGKATWTDSFGAPRGGGSRRHEGQDLMGKKMLKLLACVDGTIVELRHRSSGNSLYLMDDDGWFYCYLHINNDTPGTDDAKNDLQYAFAPGVTAGQRVKQGDHIAYLGDSGNAESSGSHCHFEIRMPDDKWYHAAAVQPSYSLLAAKPAELGGSSRISTAVDTRPFTDVEAFARQQADDFLGGTPTGSWLGSASAALGTGLGADAFIENILNEKVATHVTAPLIRLYLGFFPGRVPDHRGMDYWRRRIAGGMTMDTVASQFAGSDEFDRRYGKLSHRAYVEQLYKNLFNRKPDASGLDYWTRRLNGGSKRGWVMRQLCESPEFQRKSASPVRVVSVHQAMLQRSPSTEDYQSWWLRDTANRESLRLLITMLRLSPDYAKRF